MSDDWRGSGHSGGLPDPVPAGPRRFGRAGSTPDPRRRPGLGDVGRRVPIIGLIGPIGAGKSTVAGWLAARGAVVVDADQLTRTVMAPGSDLAEEVIARFGPEYRAADGSLDRAALGRFVFSNPEWLAALESIVHPAVARVAREALAEGAISGAPAVVLEAIKLVESAEAAWCDEIWLVTCEPAVQLERLIGRGMAEPDARQRVAAQASSLPLWRSAATRIIRSDGSPPETEELVDAALAEALARPR